MGRRLDRIEAHREENRKMMRLLAVVPLLLSLSASADSVMIPAAKDNTLYDEPAAEQRRGGQLLRVTHR